MNIETKSIILKNNKNILLRSPRPAEADLMLKHLQITHEESYQNLNDTADNWRKFPVEDEEKILKDFESSSSKFLLCAFHDKKIVGGLGFVGSFGPFLKHSARLGMSIQDAFCNMGLGTEMLKYSLEMGRLSGFHRVELTVRTYNKPGIALYEKMGFKKVGLLKDAAFIDNKYVDEFLYQTIL